ncbi:MAG: flagellar biosynthesis protein FlhF [Thermodesulfovibrionales bacterium]|nr:flagellar biosynthesis protein FlhF [Thermodesulfovibrionales bacterium]
MKIKQFTASTYKEVIEKIKRELGENALILSTKEEKGNPSFVVVTAAIDYDDPINNNSYNYTTVNGSSKPFDFQIASLKRSIFERKLMKDSTECENNITIKSSEVPTNKVKEQSISRKPNINDLSTLLKRYSIREDYALNLCKGADSLEGILSLMKLQIVTKAPSFNKGIIMLVGPTGVGKTTTIAKLSAQALKGGKRVGIINLDTYRIGACEQIRIYARIMGIPLFTAANQEAFKESIIRLMRDRDLILVDTVGRNPKDREHIKTLSNLSKSNNNLEIHLLISANSDEEYISQTYNCYQELPISCIAFTKLDEAVRYGAIYNLLMTSRKPLAYITTGQKVPEDIEFPSPEKLSRIILQLC